jgi:lauroyl/myristoyl acyltransferase
VTDGPTARTGPRASRGADRTLEAPHRRGGRSPRVVERLALAGYKATAHVLAALPPGPSAAFIGRLSQASYLLWPTKRAWSNRNFGHVLGLEPDDRRVRRLALRAYRAYGRYLVELMRLPAMPPDEIAGLVPDLDADEVKRIWRAAPNGGGLILAVAHVGNNEAVAASVARHGMPISVVADDSSFPELFELLRRQREGWGVHIVAWRNLREIYGVLRRKEMLGLLVDWGYRADGIPVRLFGAWTTLPAGPATLAAKTGSRILSIQIRRETTGAFSVRWPEPIDLASADPRELQRASQLMADALAETVADAPDQWYSFKPIWPSDPEEIRDLEYRHGLMAQGLDDPGPGSRVRARRPASDVPGSGDAADPARA